MQHRTDPATSFSAPFSALVLLILQVPVECDPDSPTLALAFKLEEGKFGQLTYMRLYQVRLAAGAVLVVSARGGGVTRVVVRLKAPLDRIPRKVTDPFLTPSAEYCATFWPGYHI